MALASAEGMAETEAMRAGRMAMNLKSCILNGLEVDEKLLSVDVRRMSG